MNEQFWVCYTLAYFFGFVSLYRLKRKDDKAGAIVCLLTSVFFFVLSQRYLQ